MIFINVGKERKNEKRLFVRCEGTLFPRILNIVAKTRTYFPLQLAVEGKMNSLYNGDNRKGGMRQMSLVIAVRDGDRVCFAADTQTTNGNRKRCNVSETNLKISRMPHGILLGHAGLVRTANVLSTHNDWFENIGEGGLTKEFLVKDIIPKLIGEMIERDYLDKEEKDYPKMNGSFLIAQGDKLYHIKSNFSVWRVHDFAMIGSGSDSSNAVLFSTDEKRTTKEKMLLSLKQAAYFDTAVDKPFVFINTRDLEYEIMEEERC